jgi:hypothetical protein
VSHILNLLIFLSAILHLQAGDWLSPESRYLGDIIILTLLFYIPLLNKAKESEYYPIRVLIQTGLFLLVINFIYVVYSFFLWGEPILTIRLARQSLLSCVYLAVLFGSVRFSSRSLLSQELLFLGLLVFLAVNVTLASFKIITPPYAEQATVFQGLLVEKIFVKGSVAVYLLSVIFGTFIFFKGYLGLGVLLGTFYILLVALYILRFRYWLIMMLVGFSIIFLIAWINRKSKKKGFQIIVILMLIIFIGLFVRTSFFEEISIWLLSAWNDLLLQKGTFQFRLQRDISRVIYQFQDHPLFILFGYGFVHKDSRAAMILGFSSETNDVGLVQFLLTYGIIGTIVYLIAWLKIILVLYRASRSYNVFYGGAAVVGLIMLMSLISSNFLLWETFFIPCLIAMRLLVERGLSECHRYKKVVPAVV